MALVSAMPVGAQVLTAPQDVIRCLCAERAVKMLDEELAARKRIYDDTRQRLNEMESALERRRQAMNVNDPAQVDAYREQFDQHSELSARFSGGISADYAAAVERYNRAVAEYNNGCSGRILDSGVVASVRPTLSCPVP
jgi:hypothetical protein